jgi:hypothetical protein
MMKSLFSKNLLLFALMVWIAHPQPIPAQLLPDQRVFDFQNLTALFVKRYAPYEWKRQALGFDAMDIKSWLERVRTAKNDLDFFNIEAEYVANLQDTHSRFFMTSSFQAILGGGSGNLVGILVDIYDGKVLIDNLNPNLLPASKYPFQLGDELIAVDGVSSEDWIKRISTWRQYGNPTTTRRYASQQIVIRSQSTFPQAIEIGDQAAVTVRRASGALENYTIPWYKSGIPVTTVGPVPLPRTSSINRVASQPDYLEVLDELHNYKLPESDSKYYVSLGSRTPHFRTGFPGNFVQRLGRNSTDFHFSGTYSSGNLTLGFLRIPTFSPSSTTAAVKELKTEIDYFQENTDGLVIDVTRNPGGGCYMIDVAAALTP